MESIGKMSLIIIIVNVLFSYNGLIKNDFFEKYKFNIYDILENKEYIRLISSGFLHVSWTHLFFNIISLYSFSQIIESSLGSINFLLIYFGSLIGGDLLSLYLHRNHFDYSSVGASGAVCGIIFACIGLYPNIEIGLMFLPIYVPGWIFGLIYVIFSIYGIRSKNDNIGHEAHLGGALIGLIISIIIVPTSFLENYWAILLIIIPCIIFIYLILTKPHILLVDNLFFKKNENYYNIDHKYNAEKIANQKEIDTILEKINKKGINSLSKTEKLKLEKFSKYL
jgi:membrane associated rhomboid family serine protease